MANTLFQALPRAFQRLLGAGDLVRRAGEGHVGDILGATADILFRNVLDDHVDVDAGFGERPEDRRGDAGAVFVDGWLTDEHSWLTVRAEYDRRLPELQGRLYDLEHALFQAKVPVAVVFEEFLVTVEYPAEAPRSGSNAAF